MFGKPDCRHCGLSDKVALREKSAMTNKYYCQRCTKEFGVAGWLKKTGKIAITAPVVLSALLLGQDPDDWL
jgi:hypothetical protein